MSILIPRFLKIGGPIMTGIGGVISTSSLVSTSAEEKPEEKLKTRTLTDEDPLIDDYKDQNESDQQQQNKSEGSEGNESSDNSSSEQKQNIGKREVGDQQPPSGNIEQDGENPPSGPQGDDNTLTSEGDSVFTKVDHDEPENAELTEKEEKQKVEESREPGNDESGSSDSGETNNESSGQGVTDSGSEDAQYNNAYGTAYGNIDREITKEEREELITMKDKLQDFVTKLSAIN